MLLAAASALLSAPRGLGAVAPARPAAGPQPAFARAVDGSRAGGFAPRFALNALLATLIDDDTPPRWTDVALNHFCGPQTRVEVDGRPLVPGARIPATAFMVRWHMVECMPLGPDAAELSGIVELRVFHEDTGLGAIVSAERMVVHGATGPSRLAVPFSASLSLAGTAASR